MDASHPSARARPSALSGRPTQSPTQGFSVLSMERTTVHSPEKSVCAEAIPHGSTSSAATRARLIVIFINSTFACRNKILEAQAGICSHGTPVNLIQNCKMQTMGRRLHFDFCNLHYAV